MDGYDQNLDSDSEEETYDLSISDIVITNEETESDGEEEANELIEEGVAVAGNVVVGAALEDGVIDEETEYTFECCFGIPTEGENKENEHNDNDTSVSWFRGREQQYRQRMAIHTNANVINNGDNAEQVDIMSADDSSEQHKDVIDETKEEELVGISNVVPMADKENKVEEMAVNKNEVKTEKKMLPVKVKAATLVRKEAVNKNINKANTNVPRYNTLPANIKNTKTPFRLINVPAVAGAGIVGVVVHVPGVPNKPPRPPNTIPVSPKLCTKERAKARLPAAAQPNPNAAPNKNIKPPQPKRWR